MVQSVKHEDSILDHGFVGLKVGIVTVLGIHPSAVGWCSSFLPFGSVMAALLLISDVPVNPSVRSPCNDRTLSPAESPILFTASGTCYPLTMINEYFITRSINAI
jgi:hypothetical protein